MGILRNNTFLLGGFFLAVLAIEVYAQRCVSEHTLCPGRGWVTTACNSPNPCGTTSGGGGGSSGGSTAGRELGAAIGTTIGQVIGDALGRWLLGDPEQQAEMRRRLRELEEIRYLEAQERARVEAIRVDEVFRRLNSELKLAGLPMLTLKDLGRSQYLGFKDLDRITKGSDELKLKLGENADGYGIPGLPGIYTGGARPTTPSAQDPTVKKDENTLSLKLGDSGSTGYGIPGLPGIYTGGARPGSSIFGDGIPGLPGIYLNATQTSAGLDQAKQLAGSAEKLSGPEKALAEAAAVDTAMQDPDVRAATDEKSVAFRRSVDEYTQAREAEAATSESSKIVQKQADTSRAIVEVAEKQFEQEKAAGLDPTALEQRRKDLAQIVAGAKTDEDASHAAKLQFETASAAVTMTRGKAIVALRGVPTTDATNSAALSEKTLDFFRQTKKKGDRGDSPPPVLDVFNGLPQTVPIPEMIAEPLRSAYVSDQSRLADWRTTSLKGVVEDFHKNCEPPQPGTNCARDRRLIDSSLAAFVEKVNEFNEAAREERVSAAMSVYSKNAVWSDDEKKRLATALDDLPLPGPDPEWNASMDRLWITMQARRDADFEADAGKVPSPIPVGAGMQTNFKDCALFALASATGTPYGVVAARITDLMKKGGWRTVAEANDPQKVIEDHGLIGGEVIFAAEALGTVEIVKTTDFARTLKSGTPIMVHVFAKGGGPHEVVLTRSFQHNAETWYEMMDSNQGPIRRLYLSHSEPTKILKENGIIYRPDPGTVPVLHK